MVSWTLSSTQKVGLSASCLLFSLTGLLSLVSFAQYWQYRYVFWFQPRWYRYQMLLLGIILFIQCCPKAILSVLVYLLIPYELIPKNHNKNHEAHWLLMTLNLVNLCTIIVAITMLWMRLWFTYFDLEFADAFGMFVTYVCQQYV